jgi:hypothetical protein
MVKAVLSSVLTSTLIDTSNNENHKGHNRKLSFNEKTRIKFVDDLSLTSHGELKDYCDVDCSEISVNKEWYVERRWSLSSSSSSLSPPKRTKDAIPLLPKRRSYEYTMDSAPVLPKRR